MIEILFGESEAASMKAAKNKVVIGTVNGPVAVWTAGKKKPPKKPFAGWIEGTSEEVICLGFMLDVGDIKEPADSSYRKELIRSLYDQNQWYQEWYQDEELRRLRRFLEDGESVRIWYSDAPYSRCGFYHLCQILRKYENEICVVKLPEYIIRENCITVYKNWGEVSAEEFAGFLYEEKKLSRNEIRMFANEWSELASDNSPLRGVINGKVEGVPEDFYDFLIWKRITRKPVKQARLIGDILGYYRLGIGDWWYAKRIEHYIRQGKIRVVEDSENKYARMICDSRE
ncbi:MAG: DUF1835 domain-containing protein [Dorea sp.]|jgi:hypothetical protein|nr:DUF1835 domain-containing protein [Dorea sp.]